MKFERHQFSEDGQIGHTGVMEDNLVIEIVKNDITKETSDAITNAANGRLKHGGGVAAAIRIAGGPEIVAESKKYIKENGEIPDG